MSSKKKTTSIFAQQSVIFWFGVLLFGSFIGYKIHLAVRLSFNHPLPAQTVAEASSSATPKQITIDAIKLDLPVYSTIIQGNTWQIDDRGISYLSSSARPGNKGPIILYGHNTNNRFGPIRWLEKGAEIKLTTTDDKVHTYTVSETLTVKPDNVGVLSSDSEALIMYTCTGLFDLERYIVKATPI